MAIARKFNALRLGYHARWLWLGLAIIGAAVWTAWLFEPYQSFIDHWWLPNWQIWALWDDVVPHGPPHIRLETQGEGGLLPILNLSHIGDAPGYLLAVLVALVLMSAAVLLFLPLGRRARAELPARRRPGLVNVLGGALQAAVLTVGTLALVLAAAGYWDEFVTSATEWFGLSNTSLFASRRRWARGYAPTVWPIMAALVAAWLGWSALLLATWRRQHRYWQYERMTRWLVLASLGLLAAAIVVGNLPLGSIPRFPGLRWDKEHSRELGEHTAIALAGSVGLCAWICRTVLLFLLPHYQRGKTEPICPGCEYDLRGTLDAGRTTCPECGLAIDEQILRAARDTAPDAGVICPACKYDLRGTLDAGRTTCPECGLAIDGQILRTAREAATTPAAPSP